MINIIIVSHNNIDDVRTILEELAGKSDNFRFWVRDNVNDNALREVCKAYGVNYNPALRREGFAVNNNIVTEHVINSATVADDDYFLFMNPDAFITLESMNKLCALLANQDIDMFTIDLYIDKNFSVRDPSIRAFPTLKTFLASFIFDSNKSIVNRDTMTPDSELDWCASSFFGIKTGIFRKLNGFDSRYFMYCEDVDICYRAKQKGYKLTYIPQIKGIHYAQKKSKKLFTRNFCWHLKSAVLFLWIKYKLSRR
ncbi:glycosyltransferase family 2 protein [Cronobacter turicensis]